MAKKKKPSRKKKSSKTKVVHDNWVDQIDFESLDGDEEEEEEEDDNKTLDVRVISWNVLAQSYLSRRSHRNLPKPFEDVVFSPKRRQLLLSRTLKRLASKNVDILCLQEVDMELVDTTLKEEHFEGVSTPTIKGGGSGSRADACCIYYNTQEWKLVEKELICFDDLSTLGSNATELASNLQGLKQSLLRRNVGIVARLEHKSTSTKVVVLNCHLYWNPDYDYVKLCQAHHAMEKCKAFSNGDPILVCGDFNSKPLGPVHNYLTRGKVNAKEVAPWYNTRRDDGVEAMIEGDQQMDKPADDGDEVAQVNNQLEQLEMNDNTSSSPQIRYMLDYTLNRFSRWLRILGIDAALETEAEEIQRTKHGNLLIFDRCREEHRTLISTSSKLMTRKDCPPGAYLINPKTLKNLESCLVHLLLSHGVILEPANFLTRCVVCNGCIRNVTDAKEKKRIFAAHQAPALLSTELACFECDGCGQGYWWCDKPTSSASRVKGQATRLFELCLRAGVEIKGPLNMFDNVDVEAERKKEPDLQFELETLQVLEWLKQEELACPIQLESSYALRDAAGKIVGECKPFTNVTSDFVGFLDYVLFEPQHFELSGRLYLPSSFNDLNRKIQLRNGHLLPSYVWPSDHLAVGAQLSIRLPPPKQEPAGGFMMDTSFLGGQSSWVIKDQKSAPAANKPENHKDRCGCGCIPPVLSLFEMAELRKKRRAAKQGDKI